MFTPFAFRSIKVEAAVALDPDAQAFLTATGITDPTIESAINNLVLDLKGASLWSKIIALYPFVGGTATTHKYNLIDPQDTDAAFRISFVNTPTQNSDGVLFNGVDNYGNTHVNASTDILQNSNHMLLSYHTTAGENGLDIGTIGTGNLGWHLNSRNATNNFATRNMSTTVALQANTGTSGVYGMSRVSSTDYDMFFNKTKYTKTVSSTSVESIEIPIGCSFNLSGTPVNYNARGFNLISMGTGLSSTEIDDFNDINTTFQTALGR